MRSGMLVLLAAVVALVVGHTAKADEFELTYVGNTLSTFNLCSTCKITFSFTVSSALAANLNDASLTPDSWQISDGQRTETQATPFILLEDQKGINQIEISTDASGKITQWDVLVDLAGNTGGFGTWDGLCPGCGFPVGDVAFQNSPTVYEGIVKTAGSWSETDLATPEPSSIVLLLTVLGTVIFGFRRHTRSVKAR